MEVNLGSFGNKSWTVNCKQASVFALWFVMYYKILHATLFACQQNSRKNLAFTISYLKSLLFADILHIGHFCLRLFCKFITWMNYNDIKHLWRQLNPDQCLNGLDGGTNVHHKPFVSTYQNQNFGPFFSHQLGDITY